ncbi:hypothetical protein Tco_0791013 [Tanacetum coccineum]
MGCAACPHPATAYFITLLHIKLMLREFFSQDLASVAPLAVHLLPSFGARVWLYPFGSKFFAIAATPHIFGFSRFMSGQVCRKQDGDEIRVVLDDGFDGGVSSEWRYGVEIESYCEVWMDFRSV